MTQSHLRAADADRAAVAELLGSHMSSGRLTVAEYDDRLARAYAARTYGELDALTADLPAAVPPVTTPAAPADPARAGGPWWAHGWYGAMGPHAGGTTRAAWASWASTALIVIGIWVMSMVGTQGWVYPWPVWVVGPWGAVLLAQTLGDRTGRARDRSRTRLPAADRGH